MNINNYIHHTDGTHDYTVVGIIPQLFLALPFMLGLVLYILAVDIIDIIIIFILCLHWFRAIRPRIRLAINK